MTKILKRLVSRIVFTITLVFCIVLSSCEAESYLVEEKPTPISIDDVKIRMVAYSEAGEKFKEMSNKLQLDNHLGLVKPQGVVKREASGNGIEIVDGLVKEITYGEYTSYTMLIKSEEAAAKFYNLVIEEMNGMTKMFIAKYEPTPKWLQEKGTFEGVVTTYRINDLQTPLDQVDIPITGQGPTGGSTTYPTDCNGYVNSTTIVTETSCGCGHNWWDMFAGICTGCPTALPTFPLLETTTYYECIPVSVPTSPGGGGSGNPPGGNNPSPNPSLTAPVGPKEGAASDGPCKKFKEYETDTLIKETLVDLKQIAVNNAINFEVGVVAKKLNPGWGFQTVQGSPNQPGIILSLNSSVQMDIFMHTHYNGLLSIFGVPDLVMFHTVLNNNSANGTDLVFMLATNAGTRYAIKVNNSAKFNAVANQYFLDRDKLKKFTDENFKDVTEINNALDNEKAFLKAIKKLDMGLSLFSANEGFSQWQELTLDPNNEDNIIPKDCN